MADHGDSEDEEPAPSLPAGTVIGGKYQIERLIGRGGMGSVWSAVHSSLGQRVAIKLIAKRYAASREARHRFDLEAKAVAQLRSRYVVQIYDHGETPDGTPYIVMEFLDGESLDTRIGRGPLTLTAAATILEQIGRALGRAHALGMVHRDLKPENIFLTTSPDGDGEVAKVLDFGIVKMRGQDGIGSSSSTRTGAVLGTPLYMSPEQARGLKSVDHRTDLYSLGMVAYTMLTGQPAFTGESLGDLLVAICTQPLPNVRSIAHWLPPHVDAWFQRACAREPAERFASAEEMTAAFVSAASVGASGAILPNAMSRSAPPQQYVQSAGAVTGPSFAEGTIPNVSRASAPVPAGTAPSSPTDHTAAPFSVTEHGIPKRSLAVPVAIVVGVLVLGGAFVATRLARTTPEAVVVAASTSPVVPTASTTATEVPVPAAIPAPSAKPPEPAVAAIVPHAPTEPSAKPVATGSAHAHAASPVAARPPTIAPSPPPSARPPTPVPATTKPGHVDLGF